MLQMQAASLLRGLRGIKAPRGRMRHIPAQSRRILRQRQRQLRCDPALESDAFEEKGRVGVQEIYGSADELGGEAGYPG